MKTHDELVTMAETRCPMDLNFRSECDALRCGAMPSWKEGFIAGYEARGVEEWNAGLKAAATTAFEKIRCDDRTDRWQVANEVAAHICALKKTGAAS